MSIRSVLHFVSLMLSVLGLGIVFCWILSVYYNDPIQAQQGLLISGLGICFVSLLVAYATRGKSHLRRRDGLAIVAFGWLAVAVAGSIPFIATGVISNPTDAFFESMSGFTTTGSSVMTNLEALPRGILFWRSLTHFFGGMGILIMFIAILPFVGSGGVQLYKAESTGLSPEKITPRIANTARIVFGVYLFLNVVCTLALRVGGLSWYDSVCNAFGAIATGGFSTRSASIAAFESAYIEWTIVFFMFISGISFVLHFRVLKGDFSGYTKSGELKFYAWATLISSLIVSLLVYRSNGHDLSGSLRAGFFQTVSLFSTTGFVTADYDYWPLATRVIFLSLMIVGACAGSTSGAIKGVRMVVVFKAISRQFRALLYPSAVKSIKLDGYPIDDRRVERAFAYVVAYLLIIALATFLVSLFTNDLTTSVSAVIACLGGVGPGMGGAGPMETYEHFPSAVKYILIVCMLLGRLELYTIIMIILPGFWKK